MHHLFDIDDLTDDQIIKIFSLAQDYLPTTSNNKALNNLLQKRNIVNIFAENSTRTKASFEIAAKNMGANVINLPLSSSSISKGETIIDTILTINSLNPDLIIMRSAYSGLISQIAKYSKAPLINAGDGQHAHPTQALLDNFSLWHRGVDLSKLKIAICGDINHSRVARSNIKLLTKLGAKIKLIGSRNLVSHYFQAKNVEIYHDMIEGIKDVDVIMMLRIQNERLDNTSMPSLKEYNRFYCLTLDKLQHAKSNVIIMHPGPINWEVDIAHEVIDSKKYSNIILEQVQNGLAIRQAILELTLI